MLAALPFRRDKMKGLTAGTFEGTFFRGRRRPSAKGGKCAGSRAGALLLSEGRGVGIGKGSPLTLGPAAREVFSPS